MTPEALPPEPAEPPRRFPFWTYQDLLTFLGLALVALLISQVLVSGALFLFHARPPVSPALLFPAQFLFYGFLFLVLYFILKFQYGMPFWESLGWVRSPWRPG